MSNEHFCNFIVRLCYNLASTRTLVNYVMCHFSWLCWYH